MLAVMLGAFGTHALKARLAENLLTIYQTAVQYHFYHALGLMLTGLMILQFPASNWLKASGWLMLGGIILFSGSLYLLSITQVRWLGAIAPVGGTAFILAWLMLFIAILRS